MANINVSNCIPFNGSRTHTVTSTDASDNYVQFTFPTSDKLVANAQLLDSRGGAIATTGMLVDNSLPGIVKIGQASAVAEVLSLTIAGTITTTGTADIVLNGAAAVNIVTTDGDTAEEVATSIAAGTYTGWTTSRVGTVVTFTATVAGAKAGANTFALTTSTGVTGTFATVTEGVDASSFTLTAGQILNVIVERDNAQFTE